MSVVRMDSIKVDEIIPGGVIRCFMTDDDQCYLIIHDFIANWCEMKQEEAVDFWKTYPDEEKQKLRSFTKSYNGPSETDPSFKEIETISFTGSLKLATMLETVDPMKKLMILMKIIYSNMRGALNGVKLCFQDDVDEAKTSADSKKRARDHEELEYKQRETAWKNQEFENIQTFIAIMNQIDRNWNKDAHLAIRTINWAREIAFGKPKVRPEQLISIYKVAKDLGRELTRKQAEEIEKNAGTAYNTRYLVYPFTTANGGFMFTERDRDLVAAEIIRFFEPA